MPKKFVKLTKYLKWHWIFSLGKWHWFLAISNFSLGKKVNAKSANFTEKLTCTVKFFPVVYLVNHVEITFSQKILKSWFDEIFVGDKKFSFFHTLENSNNSVKLSYSNQNKKIVIVFTKKIFSKLSYLEFIHMQHFDSSGWRSKMAFFSTCRRPLPQLVRRTFKELISIRKKRPASGQKTGPLWPRFRSKLKMKLTTTFIEMLRRAP